jgi:hypothetical protein
MKILIPIVGLSLVFAGCQSKALITSDQISRYSNSDEVLARETMDNACSQYELASNALLLKVKDVNSALEGKNADDITEAMRSLRSDVPTNMREKEVACDQARAMYGRILAIRVDAAERGADINNEQAMRTPSVANPVNCVSRKSFGTIYTTCQ